MTVERTISHRLVDLQSTVDDLAADIADLKAMLATLINPAPSGNDDAMEAAVDGIFSDGDDDDIFAILKSIKVGSSS